MEAPNLLKRYLDRDECLKIWPAKRSIKTLALGFLASRFDQGRVYSEGEVNEILSRWHRFDDPALLRRELFDGKLLDRSRDCARYWKVGQDGGEPPDTPESPDMPDSLDSLDSPASRLTHLAFQVNDVERTVDFYIRHTRMRLVHERPDAKRGTRVVWLREPEDGISLTLVVFQGDEPRPSSPGSLHHLGFAAESRTMVDAIAVRGEREGNLALGPTDLGEVVGYICQISDPDGNILEFSHGQRL